MGKTARSNGADLVILAGGAATRLGPANTLPKALLPVLSRPFLLWQLDEMMRSYPSLRRVMVVARASQSSLFRDIARDCPVPMTVMDEESPLGTGGAILQSAARSELSDPFLVINGDVLFSFDPAALIERARQHGAALQCLPIDQPDRYGTLEIKSGQVRAFHEKTPGSEGGVINGGLYAFQKSVLEHFPRMPCSFEMDIAPVLASNEVLSALETTGPFIDIGTPESYRAAEGFLYRNGYAKRQAYK